MKMIVPYGRQLVTDSDIDAVVEVLRSDFLTQGPKTKAFEQDLCNVFRSKFVSVVSNATAGLYVAYRSLELGEGDLLWTVPNTFVATANAALTCGADVDFVDIDPLTYCMSPRALEVKLDQAKRQGRLPKIIVPVHFAGLPCDMTAINQLASEYKVKIVEDAAHAVGAFHRDVPVGCCELSDVTVFSFHPVKIITTGEGGAVFSRKACVADKIKRLVTHGITKTREDFESFSGEPWHYEQHDLSLNFRITDIQAALGSNQLKRLEENISRRVEIAENYRIGLEGLPLQFQHQPDYGKSAWHLFVIRAESEEIRRELFNFLRSKDILVNVHYIPVHIQPYFVKLGFSADQLPESIDYYNRAISIPMFHGMTESQQSYVIDAIREFFKK